MIHDPRNIQLTPEQQQQIADLAERTGQSWQDYLATALDRQAALTRVKTSTHQPRPGESFLQVATRLGLVGCLDSEIGDLSTNPKHMEGFGE
ncbi:hypothetical protein ETAA8_01520 [Anatilimnocola aggregata]|uniref:Uncharacterized protein n=1 Tax=Anatilimnocola aggregata TaxID=2528021 RepID=A0A517Y4A7_9BACT|nr:hypothetical protein ETAA8_01520 [Anatilimnocola aggregata]